MKITTIIGARPQFIKAAVVSRAIAEHNKNNISKSITEVIIHTNQHYDSNMSDIFFEQMHIPQPNYNLNVKSSYHGAMTGRMLEKIEEILLIEQPDYVLVYGDTNSTLAGALAAAKLHIPIAHVEAGVRIFAMNNPEEINRILTDKVSTLLLCPTQVAVENLYSENIINGVYNIGDVMYDAALYYGRIAEATQTIKNIIQKPYCIATVHRAENTDEVGKLTSIMQALDEIANSIDIILPLHPRTRKMMLEFNIYLKNVKVIQPVGYFDILTLLKNCQGVFTDSGGMQKEAYFFKKPCFIFYEQTPWQELVTVGANKLVGTEYHRILTEYYNYELLDDCFTSEFYGSGITGEKVVELLLGV